jgi:hypothetical protein
MRYIEDLENALSKANGVIIGQQESIMALTAALEKSTGCCFPEPNASNA